MKQFWPLNRLTYKIEFTMKRTHEQSLTHQQLFGELLKKIALLSILLILFQSIILAQGSGKNDKLIYSFGYNEVPARCNLPLIGFINTAHGDQKSVHVGFINTNTGDLTGAQIGFVNTVGEKMDGLQVSFINTTGKDLRGFQTGFINTIGEDAQGFQVGFINAIGDKMQGSQVGFINAVKKVEGLQVGFINATQSLKGFQVGFINGVERILGTQIGFINGTRILTGLQLGFINKVETVTHGVPIGFLSFVKHGGYQAFEFSFNEMYPYNVSYKIGMDRFYTFPMVSYNPKLVDPWAIGFGAGSVIPMNEEVFFNPELISQTIVSGDFQQLTSLGLQFGHSFTENLDFITGPSVVWNMTTSNEPLFSLHNWEMDGTNRIHLGLRAAVRYRF